MVTLLGAGGEARKDCFLEVASKVLALYLFTPWDRVRVYPGAREPEKPGSPLGGAWLLSIPVFDSS